MPNRRRRFRQTTSLTERLTNQASPLRERARKLPPGSEQSQLWQKVRQAETAMRINQWLASPGGQPLSNVMPLIGNNPKSARRAR